MQSEYAFEKVDEIPSPSLLIFPEIARRNARKLLAMARGADRLRSHVKTHKMPDLVRLVEGLGIKKHKCATIAEAEMIAQAGGCDVFIAYPTVGPNLNRLVQLMNRYPETTFRASVDDLEMAEALNVAVERAGRRLPVLVDLDVGMGRTGIAPAQAARLYQRVAELPRLEPDGLHAYDGHQRHASLDERRAAVHAGTKPVFELRDQLENQGLPVPRIILGGTPTFPIHAEWSERGIECSPGTCLLHDHSYATKFPDLEFEHAALILGRVISRPRPGRICIDIGSKAVAADPVGDRMFLLDVPDAILVAQSEEHQVVDTPHAADFPPGTVVLAVPTHICPTCAHYSDAVAIEGGRVVGRWPITARERKLTI
jgi:D-serine deaminase-like pyridoxal phosphate-dependent protein